MIAELKLIGGKMMKKMITLVLAASMSVFMLACEESRTENKLEDAGEQIEETTEDVGESVEDAAEEVDVDAD